MISSDTEIDGFTVESNTILFDFSKINTLALVLLNYPISLSAYCMNQETATRLHREVAESTILMSDCPGEWVHQGGGCFKCKETPHGTYRCCEGDSKKCDEVF